MPRSKDKAPKTHEDVVKLKRQWAQDPCWDLETTEGFEKHHDELLIYRLEMEKRYVKQRYNELRNTVRAYLDALNALKGAL